MRRFVARHGGAFTPAAHFERPSHLPVSPMKTFLGVKLALLPFVLFWTAAGFGAARTGAYFATAPFIGAAASYDNGVSWDDLGLVLAGNPDTLNLEARNFWFAGGNGDF